MECHLVTEDQLVDNYHHHHHHHDAVFPGSCSRSYTASLCPWVSVIAESVISVRGD